jgi:hypothetical protein
MSQSDFASDNHQRAQPQEQVASQPRNSAIAPTTSALLDRFSEATDGLLYMSESEFPFNITTYTAADMERFIPDMLLQWFEQRCRGFSGRSLEEVTEIDLETFFQPLIQNQEWYGETERATAQRFHTLLQLIQTELITPKVYRVGQIEINIYIVGKANDNDWIVLCTQAVET